jgi:asparagine synthase (glutamine-hydrolysing)
MCGIAGLVTLQEEAAARTRLARMSAALVHRGPDGSGEVSAGGVHLAHRRLAVIDLTPCGAQPMSNEDGGVWITYNGELYGTGPLRSRLAGRGHRFRSRTDTEVLVHLYEEEGTGLFEQVDGIFAFALHDRRRRTLLLARDRLGVKPLFWAAVRGEQGPELLFGSEVKALLVGMAGRPSLRPEVLGQVLLQGYASAPDTVFEGIRLLPPACFLEIDLDGFLAGGPGQTSSLLPREYWDAPFTGDDARPAEVIEEELAGLLADAVSRQRVADVPLGAFLSGGLDSSLVTALLAQAGAGGAPVRTFTVDVPGADHGEGDKAGRVAAALGTAHTRVDLIAAVGGVGGVGAGGATSAADGYWARLAHFDVPWNGSSLLNAWLVSRAAREGGLTVALSGDGGDELFGGYDRYLPLAAAPPSPFGRALARAARPLVPAGVRGRARLDALADSEFEHAWTARFPLPVAEAERLTGGSLAAWAARQRALYERHPGDRLARACYLDLKSYLPDHVLAKVDNASMAVSLEVRVPLLDRRVVELAGRIPSGLKVAGGQGKRILRRLARRLELPPEVATQGKTGFDLPLAAWTFGNDLLAGLARPDARFRTVLDGALVDRWIAAARGGAGSRVRVPRRAALWAVCQLERWLAGEAEAAGRAA